MLKINTTKPQREKLILMNTEHNTGYHLLIYAR